MTQFFREAGVMIFLMLVTGALAFGWSVSFAYRPSEKRRRVTEAFMRATIYAGLFGFLAGMRNVVRATSWAWDGDFKHEWWQILIEGSGEAINNLTMCVAWLALVGLFVAVGEARTKTR